MKTILKQLADRLADAFAAVLDAPSAEIDAMIRPAGDAKFGHYQSNAAMALAKRAKRNPRQLAEAAVAAARLDDIALPCEIAGPGFINIRLRPEFLAAAVAEMAGDDRLGVEPAAKPESIVIDFSSPNISKEMHIGHLRSTVLGDVLCNILYFLGHGVIPKNHVGDWGTQFGMLIAFMVRRMDKTGTYDPYLLPELSDLEHFYRQAKALFDEDKNFQDIARRYVVDLQRGDSAARVYWRRFRDVSLAHCKSIYGRLGVTKHTCSQPQILMGESFYNDMLPGVVDELMALGIARESEGAKAVFFEDDPELSQTAPMIIQKSDGGYLYATTDLAAMKSRVGNLAADEIIYVTDARQQLHFRQLFATARKWREKASWWPVVNSHKKNIVLRHVCFGTIQGPDGRPFKTRSGESVKLADVLDEAVARARKVVDEKNPELPEADRQRVAEAVGIGAIKYFDLSNNRLSDYRFDWDQMLALSGNTAPYLQYAYARVRSIFRKGGERVSDIGNRVSGEDSKEARPAAPHLTHDKELALALHLARYGETLAQVVEDYRPNILCDYLYNLAIAFSGFFENCPVLKSEEPVRSDRLLLCGLTGEVMKHGLGLLGINVLEKM